MVQWRCVSHRPRDRDADLRAARTRAARGHRHRPPAPGDQLPTVRQLAVDLRVNANTVARVYAELERDGVLETRRGVGSFVRATPPRRVRPTSTTGGCARSSRACSPTPPPPDSRLDELIAADSHAHRTGRSLMMACVRLDGPGAVARARRRARTSSRSLILLGAAARRRAGDGRRPAIPMPAIVVRADRPRPDAVAARSRSSGSARSCCGSAASSGCAGPGLFWIVPFVDSRHLVDRSADDHHQLRRRADADLRHRAGQRRRGAVLDGARRAEGGARSAGLRAGGELGGADGAARHHRPHRRSPICCAAASGSKPSCRS